MKKVYVVTAVVSENVRYALNDEVRLIGVFSSEEKAKYVEEAAQHDIGNECGNGFKITTDITETYVDDFYGCTIASSTYFE